MTHSLSLKPAAPPTAGSALEIFVLEKFLSKVERGGEGDGKKERGRGSF